MPARSKTRALQNEALFRRGLPLTLAPSPAGWSARVGTQKVTRRRRHVQPLAHRAGRSRPPVRDFVAPKKRVQIEFLDICSDLQEIERCALLACIACMARPSGAQCT